MILRKPARPHPATTGSNGIGDVRATVSGFTMVELVVTIAVMGVLLLGLIQAVRGTFQLIRNANQLAGALHLLDTCLQGVRALGPDEVFVGGGGPSSCVAASLRAPAGSEVDVACDGTVREVISNDGEGTRYKVNISVNDIPDLTFLLRDDSGGDHDIHVPDAWVKKFDVEIRYEQHPAGSGRWRAVGASTWRADLR